MKKLLMTVAASVLCGLGAASANAAEMIVLPQKTTSCTIALDKMRIVVVDSALRFHWQIVEDKPGKMKLRYSKGGNKLWAEVEVVYTQKSFRINYVDSHGLGYEKDGKSVSIHRNYNRWIRNLDKEIYTRSNTACLKQ